MACLSPWSPLTDMGGSTLVVHGSMSPPLPSRPRYSTASSGSSSSTSSAKWSNMELFYFFDMQGVISFQLHGFCSRSPWKFDHIISWYEPVQYQGTHADSTSDNTWNISLLLSLKIMLYSCLSIAKPLAASYLPELFSSSESAEQTAVEVESTATDLSSSASSSPASSTIMTHSVVADILNQITRVRNCARKQMTLTAFIVGGGGVGRRCCVTIEAS